MRKIKKGDDVVVICGKEKGQRGTIRKVIDDTHVIIDNLKMIKKHTKPNPNIGVAGGIVEQEAPIHISNVMLFNTEKQAGDRVGFRTLDTGQKVRFFKSNDATVTSEIK